MVLDNADKRELHEDVYFQNLGPIVWTVCLHIEVTEWSAKTRKCICAVNENFLARLQEKI